MDGLARTVEGLCQRQSRLNWGSGVPDDRRYRSADQIASPFRMVSSPHVSFLLTAPVAHVKFGIPQHFQLVNATLSSSRVILKTRLFILLPPNNPTFLFICAPTTSPISPIIADQRRASIFGSRLIISCRVICLGQRGPVFCFILLLFLTNLLYSSTVSARDDDDVVVIISAISISNFPNNLLVPVL